MNDDGLSWEVVFVFVLLGEVVPIIVGLWMLS
jgi:hypothetical protein